MSDLVKKLRGLQVSYQYAGVAADSIEQLELELAKWRPLRPNSADAWYWRAVSAIQKTNSPQSGLWRITL